MAIVLENREELVLGQMSLVRAIAKRVARDLPAHVEMDELMSLGTVGLMDAIQRFDPSRRLNLSTFVRHRIYGAIMDGLRSIDVMSRKERFRIRQINSARFKLRQELYREPLREEVIASLGFNREIAETPKYWQSMSVISLEEYSENGDHSGNHEQLYPNEFIIPPLEIEDRLIAQDRERLIREALADLRPRNRRVVKLYFFKGLTLKQIGKTLGIEESGVGRILRRSLRIIRDKLESRVEFPSKHL